MFNPTPTETALGVIDTESPAVVESQAEIPCGSLPTPLSESYRD